MHETGLMQGPACYPFRGWHGPNQAVKRVLNASVSHRGRLLRQRRHVLIGSTAQECGGGIATRSSRLRVGGSTQVLNESGLFVFAGAQRRRWCLAC
jgi:hypothetical protein